MSKYEQLVETKSFLQEKGIGHIDFGMILGSGLGELAGEVKNPLIFDYKDIPNFPVSTVVGHAGRLVYGELEGKQVLIMDGRFHYYEGYDMETVTFPIRLMKLLDVATIIVTNSAGGANPTFEPGDLMIITDQINYTGTNPLIGPNDDRFGPRFPDMSHAYHEYGQEVVRKAAKELNINIKEGVYMGYSGPTYETPAEIRFTQAVGGDAVGMSTVPEVIVANHAGIKVIGISCITNLAAGMQANLNHEEVVETTQRVKEVFKSLVRKFLFYIKRRTSRRNEFVSTLFSNE